MMPFEIRSMKKSDIANVSEIEREIFPGITSGTSFRKEMKRDDRVFLIAFERKAPKDGLLHFDNPLMVDNRTVFKKVLEEILRWKKTIWNMGMKRHEVEGVRVVGFLGAWYVFDEMHIVSVGVLSQYRRRGVGELLLIGAVTQALASQVSSITLEVRASNNAALNLYYKYKFRELGVRKKYYVDDQEDAKIMTADSVDSLSYLNFFKQLRQKHKNRWGVAVMGAGSFSK
tara:strand:- start:9115 stop:9801 length:687 start_codon:yes stop_codon:yes gene_type:complete